MSQARFGRIASSRPTILALYVALLVATAAAPAPAGADAELTVTPASDAFGNVVVGSTSRTQTVFETNSSKGVFKFKTVIISAPFLKLGDTGDGSLDGLQTCHFDVACKPTALGTVTGTLTLLLNKDETEIINLTCAGGVSVSGTAIQNGMNAAAITAVSVNPYGSSGSTLVRATPH